jgi:hypothetical protein
LILKLYRRVTANLLVVPYLEATSPFLLHDRLGAERMENLKKTLLRKCSARNPIECEAACTTWRNCLQIKIKALNRIGPGLSLK